MKLQNVRKIAKFKRREICGTHQNREINICRENFMQYDNFGIATSW